MSDGEPLLTLFAHPDGRRWVIWTPSGYYDSTPAGEDLIGWHVNNGPDRAADFFSAEGAGLAGELSATGELSGGAAACPITLMLPVVVGMLSLSQTLAGFG